ncbi:MAG: N-acetylmuramoyl-L-alanine amidase [Thiohalospira sp.]
MKELKLIVVAGHNTYEPGALGYDNVYEHTRTTSLQGAIRKQHRIIEMHGSVIIDAQDLGLRLLINEINAMIQTNRKFRYYGIDLHFNNNFPGATGTEGFIHPNTSRTNKKIATSIINESSDIIGIPVRRYKANRDYKYPAESNVGTLGMIEKTQCPFFLYEACFLNNVDLPKYLPKEVEIAEMIVENYQKYLKSF